MRRALEDFRQRFSPRQRAAILSLGLVELGLKVLAARDIQRRPADQIRGSKLLWRLALLINTFGPLGYFLVGRRRPHPH
jgi:Phospholipase_D-nuclease N-terminal